MAEFSYFATREESIILLGQILDRGDLRAYVDAGAHKTPSAPAFTSLTDELRTMLQRWVRVYLYGPYSTHPPLFWQQDRGVHAGMHFLSQSGGGPAISFSCARSSTEGPPTLLSGSVSTQPQYELDPDHWEKPNPAFKDAYADLIKRMKKQLVRHNGVWIAPEALQLLQQGQVQLPAGLAPRAASWNTGSTPPAPPVPRAAAGK